MSKSTSKKLRRLLVLRWMWRNGYDAVRVEQYLLSLDYSPTGYGSERSSELQKVRERGQVIQLHTVRNSRGEVIDVQTEILPKEG